MSGVLTAELLLVLVAAVYGLQTCTPSVTECKCSVGDGGSVSLGAIDNMLRNFNISTATKDVTYASFCMPSQCGQTNESLVCANDTVSYGDQDRVTYSILSHNNDMATIQMNMSADARTTRILINCGLNQSESLIIGFNESSEFSTDSLFLTINTSQPCYTKPLNSSSSSIPSIMTTTILSSAMTTSPTIPSSMSVTTQTSLSSPSLSLSVSTSPSMTSHTPPSSPSLSTSPTASSFTSTSPTTSSGTSSTQPSPTGTGHTSTTSTTPTHHNTASTTPTHHNTASTTPTHHNTASTHHNITSTTPITPGPSPNVTMPPSSPSSAVPSPVCPSPSTQDCPNCDECMRKLYIAVGTSIPASILVTILAMVPLCWCFQKAKKRGTYLRMAPTVYFDEDDNN